MSKNPYQSSGPIGFRPQVPVKPPNAKNKLLAPAICIIVFTILGLLNVLAGIVLNFVNGSLSLDLANARNVGRMIGAFLIPISHVIFIVGAYNMLTLRDRKTAILAMSLACVPICTPCLFVGIPFAIWSLVVLNDPEVKAAFQSSRW